MSALSADKYAAVRLVALGTDSKRGLTKFMSRLKSGLEPFYTPEPADRPAVALPATQKHSGVIFLFASDDLDLSFF